MDIKVSIKRLKVDDLIVYHCHFRPLQHLGISLNIRGSSVKDAFYNFIVKYDDFVETAEDNDTIVLLNQFKNTVDELLLDIDEVSKIVDTVADFKSDNVRGHLEFRSSGQIN